MKHLPVRTLGRGVWGAIFAVAAAAGLFGGLGVALPAARGERQAVEIHPIVLGPGITIVTNLVFPTLAPPTSQPFPVEPPPPDLWITQVSTDLAIRGPGFFLTVDRTSGSERLMLVRQGGFRIDENGYFVTPYGFRVQGMSPDSDERVDLKLGPTGSGEDWRSGMPTITNWRVAEDGALWSELSDGTSNVVARLALWIPEEPSRLVRLSEWEWSDPGLQTPWSGQFRAVSRTESKIWSGHLERPMRGLRVTELPADPRLAVRSSSIRVGMPAVVALDGPGYLLVRDPGSGARYVTRLGLMKWDAEGWLVTALRGYRVQGRQVLGQEANSDLHRSERPPPNSEPTPAVWVSWVAISLDGILARRWSDGTATETSAISLVRVTKPELLEDAGDGFYRVTAEAEGEPRLAWEVQTRLLEGSMDPALVNSAVRQYLRKANRFLQGALMRVGGTESLGLSGQGFFILRDPISERRVLTRRGDFGWSIEGFLETPDGWRVQATHDAAGGGLADLQLPREAREDWRVRVSIEREGDVVVSQSDGVQRGVATVVLARVPDPMELVPVAGSEDRFEWGDPHQALRVAGNAWGRAGTLGLGMIQSGALEIPNDMIALPPALAGHRGVHVELFGAGDGTVRVERSDDLVTWSVWAEFFGASDGWEPVRRWSLPLSAMPYETSAFDMSPPSPRGRFYRLRTP